MYLNGRVGQVLGPFDTSDLLAPGGAIFLLTPEIERPILEKLGVQASPGTLIQINGVPIRMGKTGIYELDNIVLVKSLIFPQGADGDTIVDFVY